MGVQESLTQKAPKNQDELLQGGQCQGSSRIRLLMRFDREAGNLAAKVECWKQSIGSGVVISETPFRVDAPAQVWVVIVGILCRVH